MIDSTLRYKIENDYEWREWIKNIPYINFPPDWNVKIMPPFGGAMIRFKVKKNDSDKCVSVYLDCHHSLGYYGESGNEPYWEIYPAFDGDTARFDINNIKEIMEEIEKSLNHKENLNGNDW